MSFEFAVRDRGDNIILELHGRIDENANFKEIRTLKAKSLTINLKGITLMNSVGLRSWIQWVKTLKKIPVVYLENCTTPVMNQMNVLQGFLPLGAVVNSIEVPYHCENCGHGFSHWAKRGDDYRESSAETEGWNKISEEAECPECGNKKAETDFLPARYFNFLKNKA